MSTPLAIIDSGGANIASLRAALARLGTDSVVTTIPSAACVAQDATNFGFPSTDTRQIRQLPTTGSLGYQHSVGTSMSAARAASRIV